MKHRKQLNIALGPAGNQQGMTLIEILVALMIIGTIMTLISATLSGSINILNATQDKGAVYHRAQVAMMRISEDIGSAILASGAEFTGVNEEVEGEDADALSFGSTSHIDFSLDPVTGIALITYSVKEDEENKGEFLLVRTDRLLTAAGSGGSANDDDGLLLCDRLKSVNFTYLNKDGEEMDEWPQEQASQGNGTPPAPVLPVAVTCTLEFWIDRDEGESIEFTTSILLPAGLING